MSVDGSGGPRVHRRVASIARQQIDIVSFLETDRPGESRWRTRIRVGSNRARGERKGERTCFSALVAFGALSRSRSS